MSKDISPSAHALLIRDAHKEALVAYGVDPHALMVMQEKYPLMKQDTKAVAQISRESRALSVQQEHNLVAL